MVGALVRRAYSEYTSAHCRILLMHIPWVSLLQEINVVYFARH